MRTGHRSRAALWLAVAAPLCWVPGGFTRFGPATLLVLALAGALAAAAPAAGRLPRALVLAGAAWLVVLVVASLVGETPLASLVGRWPRYEGLPVLAVYAGAAWLGARVVGRDEPGTRRLSWAVGATAVALATLSLLDLAGVSPVGPGGLARSGSVLGNATDQAAVAMMAALLVAGRAIAHRHPVDVVVLVAALTTVAVSGSRTALVLTVLGLAVVVAVARRHPGRGMVLPSAAALVVLAGAALAVPTTRDRLLGLGTGRGRVEQWRLTLDLVRDHPWLGLGPSRYVDAFPAYENASFVRFTGPYRLADSPHSIVLQVVVAGGLVLLVASSVGLLLLAVRCRAAVLERPEVAPALIAVGAYALLLTVNVTSAAPLCLAALLLGSVMSVAPSGRGPVALRAVAGVAWAMAAVVLAAACVGDVRLQDGLDAADSHQVSAATSAIDDASVFRPWDSDVDLLGAAGLAQEATRGGRDGALAGARSAELARAGLARTPESYDGLVSLGVALLVDGRLDEAYDVLDRAVAVAPYRPDGYVQRAIASFGLDDVEAAVDDLRLAQRIVPGSATVRRLLSRVEAAADG
ncbi:MAG: O-antigen ligase family protein [Rhodoferax sp.]|nr:O-antigen ligase family protein [Actinomycetota bacterium]